MVVYRIASHHRNRNWAPVIGEDPIEVHCPLRHSHKERDM